MQDDSIKIVAMQVSAVYGVTKRKFADEVAKNIIEDYTQKYFVPALMDVKFLALFFLSTYLLYELSVTGSDLNMFPYLIMTMFIVYVVFRMIHLFNINNGIDSFHNGFMCHDGQEGKYLNQYLSDSPGIDLLKHSLRLTNTQNRYVYYTSIILIGVSMYCLWKLGFQWPLTVYIGLCSGCIVLKALSTRKAKWFLRFLEVKHMEFNVFHGVIRIEIR